MKKRSGSLFLGIFFVVLNGVLSAALPELFPVEQLKPGMRGQTHTVMQGTEIVTLETEILGVLINGLGPGKDLIIGKLIDEKSRVTGAVHGMSGSPLYIDGKLVGALSRRLMLFEKDGHCGFTPIRDMLDVARRGRSRQDAPNGISPFLAFWNQPGLPAVPEIKSDTGQYLSVPVSISGWTQSMLDSLVPVFSRMPGLVPVAGGSGTSGIRPAPKIEIKPGSALSIVLIDGDIRAGGTGTATTVDGNKVTAFGHPMLGVGPTELPMAGAEIITTMPSYLMPHKISNMGQATGTIWQDRLSAVSGELGRVPPMAGYEIARRHQNEARPTYKGTFVKDELLAPQILMMLMATSLIDEQDFSMEATLKLSGEIRFKGLPPLKLSGLYSGDFGQRVNALFDQLSPVAYLYQNFPKQIEVENLKLSVETYELASQWSVETMSVRNKKLKKGEKIQTLIRLKNGRGEKRLEEVELSVPEELKSVSFRLRLAGGNQLQRSEKNLSGVAGSARPGDYLSSQGSRFEAQALYLQVITAEQGVMSRNRPQVGLPYSTSQVIKDSNQEGVAGLSSVRVWNQTAVKVPGVAVGSQEIAMEVE